MAKKILLAEDSITMQKVVEMTFAAEEFAVTSVSTADGAIQQAKELKPDVLIADLSMEGKNGYDVCSAVKADPALSGIPVLLLHGSAAPYDPEKGKSAKADGEIAKPFETQALIDKVKALAEAGPVAEKEPMGPIESLAPPMGGGEDIVIDTSSLDKPAAAKPAAPAPKPAAPKPAAPAAKPAVPPLKPPAAKPAAAKPAVPPLKPPAAKPAVPPLKPPAAKPAAAAPANDAVEITIEAEPPPAGAGGVSWDAADFDQPPRTDATLLGVGKPAAEPAVAKPVSAPAPAAKQELPPPPAGMPLPGAPKPVQPGQPYEPAVYEAITKLSRDVIERIVWEVVPDLAEQIIREELDRLVEKRRSS